jgi:hypothetical protein
MSSIVNLIQKNIVTILLMIVFVYIDYHLALGGKPMLSVAAGLLPFLFILVIACIRWPNYLLAFVFIVNYTIMGLGRYLNIPIPITILFELLFAATTVCLLFRMFDQQVKIENAMNLYWLFTLLWLVYCVINVGNGITGQIRVDEWYRQIRTLALYPLIVSVLVALHAKHYNFIKGFLVLWAILTLTASAKGYYQRNVGFDHAEWAWLMGGGAKTHLIATGVRYFSYFTDAANFGCNMALSMITFGITSIYTRNLALRILFMVTALSGGYGMLISGTRAAMAVPIVGIMGYIILCKNRKIFLASSALFIVGTFLLVFTKVGDGQPMVHRMRTAFDKDDASMNVRLENQKAIKAYMAEAPFGIGLGLDWQNTSPKNKFYIVASTPPDSDLVNIWIHTGQVGLTIYLILQVLAYGIGGLYLLFRIKNDEIRGPLVGMLCGCAGLCTASYANMVYIQFPSGIIVYTCMTLVMMSPYFDKQYTEEHAVQKA